VLKEPIRVVGPFERGGLGELLRCGDANGMAFAAKFPKDASLASQQMILDEERRFRTRRQLDDEDGSLGFAATSRLRPGSIVHGHESSPWGQRAGCRIPEARQPIANFARVCRSCRRQVSRLLMKEPEST